MATLKTYYALTKPGIVYGNTLAAVGGFFLASLWHPDWWRGLAMIVGLALVVASACVFNNYLDSEADARMARTQGRALAQGTLSSAHALIFGILLGLLGLAILFFFTNPLSAAVAFFGWFAYVVLYTLSKPHTSYAMHIGIIAGAVPPVIGYTAASNSLDLGALILFVMFCFWQLPHFLAIAVRRKEEYRAAGTPVLPLVRSEREMRWQITGYIFAFGIAAAFLTFTGYAGYGYLILISLLSLWWFIEALRGFNKNSEQWAKRIFFISLAVLLGAIIGMSLNPTTPQHHVVQKALSARQ